MSLTVVVVKHTTTDFVQTIKTMSEKANDTITCNTTLLTYANHVPVGLLYYTHVNDKKHHNWGLVTTADVLTPNTNKPEDVDNCYVFWDVVTNDWITVGYDDVITWTIEHLDKLKHLSSDGTTCPSPEVLLRLGAEDTTNYHKILIDETTDIINKADIVIESKNLNLSKSERLCVVSGCFKHKPAGMPVEFGLQPDDIPDIVNAPRGDATLNDVLDVFQEYDLKACNCYLALECFLDFSTIVNDTLTQEEMSLARDKWINFIRKHRLKAFEELDQLEEEAKKSGSSEEDLQDIDTIKQMFRDIPQDTDLSQYKTLGELIDFWPSLLLPKPLVEKPVPYIQPDPEKELVEILKGVDDIEELQTIIDQVNLLGSTAPDYAIEKLTTRMSELKTG